VKIRTVDYAGTVATPQGPLPGDLPQVAFSGRSNVGKSSLINTLLRRTRHKIARVSSTPGKTQAVNFYEVNGRFYLVDLPGFGWARVSKTLRDSWRGLVEGYLSRGPGLRGVVHLVDCRREPTEQDLEMMDYLARLGVPTLVVLTKIDKVNRSQRDEAVDRAARTLGVDREQLLPFSARTGEGRDALLGALDALLGGEGPEESEESEESEEPGEPEESGESEGPEEPRAPKESAS
jgi:GTP-binding protein